MSAGIRQLRRQANEIQDAIANLQRESERRDRTYQQEHEAAMRRLRTEMEAALARQDRHRYMRIQQQMGELNEQLMERIRTNHLALKRELTSNLEVRHQELLRQLDGYYQDVRRQLDDEIANVQQEKDAERKEIAEKEWLAAQMQYNQVAIRPHEELFPGRMQVFQGTLIQAEKMIRQNQPQASAATSVMLNVSLKDFEYSINECISQILQSYLKMEHLYTMLKDQLQNEILTIDHDTLSEDTAKRWLDDEFSNVFAIMGQCGGLMAQMHGFLHAEDGNMVSTATVERFLKSGASVRQRDLDELIRELKYQIPGDMKKMQLRLQSAYRCAAQRKSWAKRIMAHMQQRHNTGAPLYHGFEDGDESNRYCMKFAQPSGNYAKSEFVFHIVPVLMDGSIVNHIRIFMDFHSGNSVFEKREELKYVKNIMQAIQETSAHIGIGRAIDVLDGGSDEEYHIQPAAGNPSKMQLIKKSHADRGPKNAAGKKGRYPNLHSMAAKQEAKKVKEVKEAKGKVRLEKTGENNL